MMCPFMIKVNGGIYAAMSGSVSVMFGLFKEFVKLPNIS